MLTQQSKIQSWRQSPNFKVKRKIFDKGFTPNWTEEIFVIDEILNTNPLTYKLVDLLGEKITGSILRSRIAKDKIKIFFELKKLFAATRRKRKPWLNGKDIPINSILGFRWVMRKKYSAERIRREYECFVIHIHNFKTPLHFAGAGAGAGAFGFSFGFSLLSFNSSYISQRRLLCFASSCLISLFSSRRLMKDS